MKRLLLILWCVGVVMADRAVAETAEDTSIIAIVANPNAYDGKQVRIDGYLHYRFEDKVLYPTKEFADHLLSLSAIWVSELKSSQHPESSSFSANALTLDGKYVVIEGCSAHHGKVIFRRALEKLKQVELRL